MGAKSKRLGAAVKRRVARLKGAPPSAELLGSTVWRELGDLDMESSLGSAFEEAGWERTPDGFGLRRGHSELAGAAKSRDGWCEWRIVCRKGAREVVLDGECGALHAWLILGDLARSAPALLELDYLGPVTNAIRVNPVVNVTASGPRVRAVEGLKESAWSAAPPALATSGAELVRRYAVGERDFSSVRLQGCDLTGAVLSGARLSGAKLEGARLEGARLDGVTLGLCRVHLQRGVLRHGRLRGADLRGANLGDLDASGADFSRAVLSQSQASNANFQGACLAGADLTGATFRSVNLRGADLSGATLSGAVLAGSDLRGADLSGTALAAVELEGVLIDATTKLPEGISRRKGRRTSPPRKADDNVLEPAVREVFKNAGWLSGGGGTMFFSRSEAPNVRVAPVGRGLFLGLYHDRDAEFFLSVSDLTLDARVALAASACLRRRRLEAGDYELCLRDWLVHVPRVSLRALERGFVVEGATRRGGELEFESEPANYLEPEASIRLATERLLTGEGRGYKNQLGRLLAFQGTARGLPPSPERDATNDLRRHDENGALCAWGEEQFVSFPALLSESREKNLDARLAYYEEMGLLGPSRAFVRVVVKGAPAVWYPDDADSDDEAGPFAYSIGLYYLFNLPEILLVGRDPELTSPRLARLVQTVASAMAVGGLRLRPGDPFGRVVAALPPSIEAELSLDLRAYEHCRFFRPDEAAYERHLGFCSWFYANFMDHLVTDYPALSCRMRRA
jgi:uncharacterized protein YjbI with pentapeptide repeats